MPNVLTVLNINSPYDDTVSLHTDWQGAYESMVDMLQLCHVDCSNINLEESEIDFELEDNKGELWKCTIHCDVAVPT